MRLGPRLGVGLSILWTLRQAARRCSPMSEVYVVGNEAADVDSLVSAYVMAEVLRASGAKATALAQIPREEFRLRGDAVALFRRAGSKTLEDGSPVGMAFWDEVKWEELSAEKSVVLVDHNKMTDQVAKHFERVVQVLDHHAGGVAYPEASTTIDEALGSCCSLVVEQAADWSTEHSTLLAGVILLDCRNFDEEAKKGTARDLAALKQLERAGMPAALSKEATKWYKELMEARKDVSHLTCRDLMLLDTKVVNLRGFNVAVASMFGTLSEVSSKAGGPEGVEKDAKRLSAERNYQAMILLFSKDKLMGKKRAVAFVADPEAMQLCEDIAKEMALTPGNLPKELRENPLYQTQGLVDTGFQMERLEMPLLAYSLKGDVSRKTVLPFAHLVARKA